MNAASPLALNDREIQDASCVYGTKFSPDGGLLFQPAVQGLDIYDGRLGTLRARLALPVPLSTNYDALVSDGQDNVLILITGTSGNGIAILDLSSVQEPAPPPYATALARSRKAVSGSERTRSMWAKDKRVVTARRVVPHVIHPLIIP